METFVTATPYDIIFANPPFVPTPPSITGVVHSNGGADGCGPTRSLLSKLGQLLKPDGQAMIRSLQIEGKHGPILAGEIREASLGRPVEMMRTTDCYIDPMSGLRGWRSLGLSRGVAPGAGRSAWC